MKMKMNHSIVPVNLVVKSMRDNGYKNTAFAIAELIDNSIQYGSNEVTLICLEKEQILGSNTVSITTNAPDDSYYTSRSQITMTVKEARAFQGFLNAYIDGKTIAPTID